MLIVGKLQNYCSPASTNRLCIPIIERGNREGSKLWYCNCVPSCTIQIRRPTHYRVGLVFVSDSVVTP